MTEPKIEDTTSTELAGEDIVCSKCGASNPSQARKCFKCEAHLRRRCSRCMTRNLRTAKTCVKCGNSLQKDPFKRIKHKLSGKKAQLYYRIVSAIILLFLIGWGFYLLN